MTLAEVIALTKTAGLTPLQQRDQLSAVRTIARLLEADPSEIEADPARLRRRLEAVAPEAIGISRARWANLRSLLGKALEHGRLMMPARRVTPLSVAWATLLARVDDKRRIRLSALARHFSAAGVEPMAVTLDDLKAYGRAMIEDRLRRSPERAWDELSWSWNASMREVEGWPKIEIPRKDRRNPYVLAWATFPTSLKLEVDAFLRRQSGADLCEEGPPKPLRASSLKTRERQLRVAAAALVHRGVSPSEIRGISDMLSLERFKEILTFFLDRRSGKTSTQVGQLASFLKGVAVHWLGVDDLTEMKMKRLVSRLSVESRGMTPKNRERLRPFDDPETVGRFVCLPQTIRNAVDGDRRPARLKAVAAQCAAAVAILQAAPIRIANLVQIDMRGHLIERAGRVYLVIPATEVKNREPIDLELPASAIEVVAWYALHYRPHLLRGKTDALFPGKGVGPKSAGALGPQITREVFQRTGLRMNPHLFRHAAGKIFLDQKPGQYEVVRRLLGHKSLQTTTAIYTGAETRAAGQLFASVIDDLRGGPKGAALDRRSLRALKTGGGR